jgi:hypothetical protein
LQTLFRESLQPFIQAWSSTGITQPLVGYEIIELVEVADVDLELDAHAVVEHVDLGDVGCGLCASQVDPVGARGRHGESCHQQQESRRARQARRELPSAARKRRAFSKMDSLARKATQK